MRTPSAGVIAAVFFVTTMGIGVYNSWTGQPPSPPTVAQIRERMFQELLAAHNDARRGIGLKPLALSPELSKEAQLNADLMCSLETLYYHGRTNESICRARTPKDVMKVWAYQKEPTHKMLGDYQIVGFGESGGYWSAKYR